MEPQIENFSQVENFILTQPQKADERARAWDGFVSRHPETAHFQFKQEFDAWATTHNVSDTTIWVGKEIRDAYFYLRQKHEAEQMEQTGHADDHEIPDALAALGFLGGLFSKERPKILEEDPHFKRLLKEKKDTWLKEHPGKDLTSKEWVDYRYGSLDDPTAHTLFGDATKECETNPKYKAVWDKYSAERKKVYSDPSQDPTFIWHQEEIELHTQVRHELLKKEDPSITLEHVKKQVEASHWERFAEAHPEKATAYAAKHKGIQEALIRVKERKEKQAIHDQLTNYQQTTGKEIHYVEDKTHRPPPSISAEETIGRLKNITPPSTIPILRGPITPTVGLVTPQGRPLGSIPSVTTPTPLQPLVQRPQTTGSTHAPSGVNGGGSGQQGQHVSNSAPTTSGSNTNGSRNILNRGTPLLRGAGRLLSNPNDFISGSVEALARKFGTRVIISFITSNPITIIILLLMLSVLGIMFSPGTVGEASPFETAGSSNISSCQFTRLGTSSLITSQTLSNIINTVAQQEGVPAAILASLARHESDLITKTDSDSNIQSGKYCNPGVPFCEYKGTNLHSGECVANDLAGSQTAQAMGVMQIIDVYNKDIDVCNIQQNIAAGAQIFKAKLGAGSLTNENDVKKAVCGYFGKKDTSICLYTANYDYGKEVWDDFQNCQQTQIASTTNSSVSSGWPTSGRLTQGPKGASSHLSIFNGSSGTKQAVDIANALGTPVYASFPGKVLTVCTNGSACPGGTGNTVVLSIDGKPNASILYGHFSEIDITQGALVIKSTTLGKMGATGHVTGNHLHWEFQNISFAPPNIPKDITPSNCDDPPYCDPLNIPETTSTTTPTTNEYWFLLHRKSNKEYLYLGIPGDTNKSQQKGVFTVKTGKPGERPTPLPQLAIGKDYWLINAKKDTSGDPSTSPRALILNIPYNTNSYGPEPYNECGGKQCNWGTSGWFGLHGINGDNKRIDNDGSKNTDWSSGCIRHYDNDIMTLYDLLGPIIDSGKEIRYYIQDN